MILDAAGTSFGIPIAMNAALGSNPVKQDEDCPNPVSRHDRRTF
jgi:hypothetical protein